MKWKEKAVSSDKSPGGGIAGGLKLLLLISLLAWGTWSAWQLRQARQAGAALRDVLLGQWLAAPASPAAKHPAVLTAVERFGAGQFGEAGQLLAPAADLTPSQQDAARRFLGRQPPLRQRLIAVASAAEDRQREGGEVGPARAALSQALAAAAEGDPAAVAVQLGAAESALDRDRVNTGGPGWPADAAGVAARAAALEPAVRVGQDLLTEGYAAAGRLIGRAAWECQAQRYDEAAALLDLAAGLLGIEPVPNDARTVPAWFLDLAQTPPASVEAARAQAAVELAEAVAQAESRHPVVESLVARARREFDAGRAAEADWWASVALAAQAMDPQAVASAAGGEEASEP